MINACVTKYNKNTSKDNSLFFIQDWSTGAHAFCNSEQKSHCSTEPVFFTIADLQKEKQFIPVCLHMSHHAVFPNTSACVSVKPGDVK